MKITVEQLRAREVINIHDGTRLGYVNDIEFDISSGKVEYLLVPGRWNVGKLIGKSEDGKIPWDSIKRIGNDIILIDSPENAVNPI